MTDSMKFGPEWLRNMAADHQANNSTSTASIHANNNNNNNNVNNNNMSNHNSYNNSNNNNNNSGVGGAAARNMFPEFRYGREEMLLLFEKNCPLPEILTSYKSLFVEKAQMPLAMTPSSEDEAPILPPALQSRPNWMQRSPLGFSSTGGVINNIGNGSGGLSVGGVGVSATSIGGGIVRGGGSTRGGGGGSFERGRARGKSTYSMYSRTISGGGGFNDDGTIKEPRPWNERNGNDTTGNGSGNGVTSGIDWNGTPNSSPRKEFSSHTRNIENWRKTRHDNDGTSGVGSGGGGGDAASIVNTMSSQQIANSSISPNMDSSGGWRGSLGGATSSSAFRWGRSTSWRDDDGNLTNESNSVVVSPSPASGTGVAVGVQRSFSGISTDRGALQQHPSTASIGMAANKAVIKTRLNGEVDDNLPEWAMENPLQTGVAGGTFDAAGAFHGSNENDYQNDDEQKQRKVETTTNNSEQQEEETENKDEDEDKVDETTNNSTDNDVENVEIIEHIENVDNIVDETNTTTISDNVVNSEMFKNNIINDGEPQQQHMSNKLLNTLIVQDNNKMKEQDVSNSSSITTITTTTSSETTTSGDNEMAIWFYRDPQAKIQGPFTAMEMCEWHRAGYFNEQLYVRRVCDQRFRTLGELLKLCHGQMPFTHTHLLDTNANNQNTLTTTIISSDKPNLTTTAAMVPTKVTTLQQHLLDGNLLVDQQQQQQHTHYTNMLDNLTAAAESISMACKNLNSIEMSHMLALHFQNLQKKYLQQQEMLIISELNKNECFQRLAQHEKESIIQQKLRLICVPDYLLNLSGLSEALAQHNPIAGLQLYHVIAECNKRTLTEAATTTQTPSLIDELFLQPQQPPPTLAHNMLLQQQQHLQHQQQLIQQQHRSDFMPLTSPTIAAASLVEQEQFMQMWSNSSTSLQQPPILPQTNIQQQILQPTTIPTNPWNLMLNHQNNTVLPQRPVIGGRNSAAVVIANVPTVAQIEKQQQQKHFSNIWQQQQQQSPPLQDQPVLGNSNNMNIQQEQQSADVKMTTPTTSSEKPVQSQQQHETAVKQNAAATKQQQKINKKQTSTEVVATTQPAATNKRANKPQQPPPQVTNNTKLNKKQQHQHQQQLQNDDGGDFQQQQQRRTREQNEELKQQRKQRQQQQQQEDELKAKERELRELAKEKERQQLIQEQRRKALTSGSGGNVVGETTKKSSSSIAPWSMLNMNKKNTSGYDENGDENFMNVGGGELVNVVQPLSLIEIQKAERREQQQQRAAMELQQQQQQALQQQQQLQQQMQQHNLLMQHHDNKWNSPLTNIQVKSFAEIQAEETKRMAILEQQRKQELLLEQQQHHHHNENVLNTNLGHHLQSSSSLVMNATSSSVGGSSSGGGGVMSSIWGANNAWGTTNNNNNNNSSSIWGDDSVAVVGNNKYGSTPPSVAAVLAAGLQQQHQQQQQSKSTSIINKNSIKKSQTVSTMQQNNNTSSVKINKTIKQQQVAVASAANRAKSETDVNAAKRSAANAGNLKAATTSKQKATTTAADLEKEFTNWCTKSLNNMHAKIDVPTFVGFLHELESPYDIKDYIRMYLGESKECIDFSKQFLERRSKCRSLQRAQNAHNDDMCKPAPAITPCAHDNSDKGKQKKEKKKGKMTKLDARILGFSVTAAAGRINVGDRDYVDGP